MSLEAVTLPLPGEDLEVWAQQLISVLAGRILYISEGDFIPTKAIVLWPGSGTNLPAGWVKCDGAFGTPDLTASFVPGTIYAMKIK